MDLDPNRDVMERHIRLLTDPWREGGLSALMELRCLKPSNPASPLKFDPSDEDFLDDSLTKAVALNQSGWNIYVCVNPISSLHVGPANDDSIIAAYFAFADADDGQAAAKIQSADKQPDFYVQTGTNPTLRLHAYWRVEDVPDLETWKELQKKLISSFGSDPAIINPSRIMRLAGTVSYPSEGKRQRGYTPELTILKEMM